MSTTQDPIISKIRALLSKTMEQGATQAESESAISLAQKLMTKHNIDKMVIESAELLESRKNRPLEIIEHRHQTGRQRYETDNYISRILRNCFSVRVLWGSTWEVIKSKNKYGSDISSWKKRLDYYIVGDKDDVEFAKVAIEQLHPMMRRFHSAYLRANGQVWSAISCHSFYEGLTDAYIEANKKGKDEAMLESGVAASDQYALVLVDKEKAIKAKMQTIHTVRGRSTGPRNSWAHDDKAFGEGKKAGKKLSVGAKQLE